MAITVKFLSGPETGIEWNIVGGSQRPDKVINMLLQLGWDWGIDLSRASDTEKEVWEAAHFSGRCVRALRTGRSVWFLGKEYRGEQESIFPLSVAVYECERKLAIGREDETGVEIIFKEEQK